MRWMGGCQGSPAARGAPRDGLPLEPLLHNTCTRRYGKNPAWNSYSPAMATGRSDGRPPWQPETAWPDPFVAAASLAAMTTRLRFLVSVFVLPMRHPALAAKTILTTAVMTGGRPPRALRRAATLCDGWATQIQTRSELAELLNELRRLRAASPRADEPFAVSTAVRDAFDEAGYRELEALGVTDCITVPWMFYGTDTATASCNEKCDGIRRFGDEVLSKLGYAAPRAS